VLVVGGGRSGIRAATELSTQGRDVLVLDRARSRVAPGDPQVTVRTSTTCLGLYPDEGIAAAVGPAGPIEIRSEKLVIATGAYDAWLLFQGNDLPGILGVRAFEHLATQGAFPRGRRVCVFAAPTEAERALAAAEASGIELAWLAGPAEVPSTVAPSHPWTRIVRATGRRRVTAVELEGVGRLACDVLVVGFTQPTYELQAHAGIPLAVRGVPPRIVVTGSVDGVGVVGEAATEPVDVPGPSVPHPGAFVCPCEDVRVRDVEAAVADGFDRIELVKRRTGASTGPCQGRLCLALLVRLLTDLGLPEALPTARPPIVPVELASLAADG
jgi:sarcosine oxidase subunit alpha